MKDLNELMQAILDMDAAQRTATDQAMAKREAALSALAGQKALLEQHYAARTEQEIAALTRQQEQKCDAFLKALREKKETEARQMALAAAAQTEQWAQVLVQRALEG